MKAAITYGPGDIRIEEIPIPKPGPREVLIKVKAVGICGSDLHYHRKENNVRKPPFIAGHEISGEIVKLGKGVHGLRIGEKVVVEPLQWCHNCEYCQRLRFNLCLNIRRLAGGLAEYANFPIECIHPIPSKISFEIAAFIEVVAVGLHALAIQPVGFSDEVLIVGDGPVGLTICRLCKLSGARKITVVGMNKKALQLAKELGANKTINAEGKKLTEVKIETQPGIIFEGVGGFSQTGEEIAQIVPKGGTIIIVGIFKKLQSLDFAYLVSKEVQIKFSSCFGTNGNLSEFKLAMELVANGEIPVGKFITHRFSLSETPEAFRMLLNKNQHKIIKAIIFPTK